VLASLSPVVDVRRAGSRFTTEAPGIRTRHSFSFGRHYDPANVGHTVLVAHNDDRVEPGSGYDLHPHADLEIVTWVLSGSLVHQDSEGHAHVVGPGQVQRLSAGSGVRHSERNDAPGADEPTRFVQMWVLPDEPGLRPSYDLAAVSPQGLTPLASGIAGLDAAVRIHTTGAALHVARLAPGEAVTLPDGPRLHVFVARGAADLEGAGRLDEGDAARFNGEGAPRLATGRAPAEVLVWQLP
jgi:redox-sensitive bicupin YhaK (pirin superfamily)